MGGRGTGTVELLAFDLGGRICGLPADDVIELVRAVAIDPLPNGPRVVSGVINARGRIVPVFDLRIRFGMPPTPVEPSEHFILARAGERVVALRADRAIKLATVALSDIQEAERIVTGAQHISGIGKIGDGIVFIHDLGAFLSEAERATLDVAMAAEAQ